MVAARNANTPVEILRKLAKDEELEVRTGVARNRNIPKDLLCTKH